MKWTAMFNGDSIDRRAQAVWPWPLKTTHTETKITKKQLHSLFNILKEYNSKSTDTYFKRCFSPFQIPHKPHSYSRASFTPKPQIFFPFPEP